MMNESKLVEITLKDSGKNIPSERLQRITEFYNYMYNNDEYFKQSLIESFWSAQEKMVDSFLNNFGIYGKGEPVNELMSDFPKVQCPFVRKIYPVALGDFKKYGHSLKLRTPEVYLVTNEINPGFEWVFDDPGTIAVEKLDGTNVKVKTHKGRLVGLQNRLNVIDPLQIMKGKAFIVEGIFTAIQKGYISENGEQAGEVIGPKLQGNPYGLANHIWYPFEKSYGHLKYKSFHEHERTFANFSSWFKDYLKSLFHSKMVGYENAVFAEGVIFYNLRREEEGKTYMAKLRRDMFDWYYSDKIEILKESK